MKEKIVRFIMGVLGYGVIMISILYFVDWNYPSKWTFILVYSVLISLADLFIFKKLSQFIYRLLGGKGEIPGA
ncbi:MAG: hypothetical protein K9I34_05600 [Bacteroidales bacterium]|nr:hypothetical protein [Bacteroidales bacterium]